MNILHFYKYVIMNNHEFSHPHTKKVILYICAFLTAAHSRAVNA